MTIVIVGAGTVGSHIAQALSGRERSVIMVEQDGARLEQASRDMDIATRVGDGSNWQLLDELIEQQPTHLLAMTYSDQTNLVCCNMAKHLGYPTTVARVKNQNFYNPTRLDFGRIFSVDHFIGPEWLAAQHIARSVLAPGALYSEMFAHGVVHFRTVKIPESWKKEATPIMGLDVPRGMMIGLIRRQEAKQSRVIFPHGNDVLLPGDEVSFIGEVDVVNQVHEFLGVQRKPIRSVTIGGGSLTAIQLARLLVAQGIRVRVIDRNYESCCRLAELLPNCTIMHHDMTDRDFLRAERVGQGEAFVVATQRDEINLMTGALARGIGCKKVITLVSDIRYRSLYEQLGISQVVSPRMLAADRILSIVGAGSVSSMVSLYENQAEIVEVKISEESRFVGIPLAELGPRLPKDFLIAIIQNRGRVMVANGSRVLSPGDTMVVITHPRHIEEFQKIF